MINNLKLKLKVKKYNLSQQLKYFLHARLNKPLAFMLYIVGCFIKFILRLNYGFSLILKSRRIANINMVTNTIDKIISKNAGMNALEDLLPKTDNKTIFGLINRVLILKLPNLQSDTVVEKGVIIVKFTETFTVLYKDINVSELLKYFYLVLEPSWVGYSLPEILIWNKFSDKSVIILSPRRDDFELVSRLGTSIVPVSTGSADWVNPEKFYKKQSEEKAYDVIYLANFNPIKRVERFVRAIKNISSVVGGYKAVLVLASHGVAKNELEKIIEDARNSTGLSVFSNLSQDEINTLFNKSKVNILISLREGQNKGLAEGMFAGTPSILLKECASGNYLHINESTGKIVEDKDLEEELMWFADNYQKYKPDVWANKNISPQVSTSRLQESIKEIEGQMGRQWSKDMFVKVNQPELSYLDNESDYLLSMRSEILNLFLKGSDISGIQRSLQNITSY